MTARNKTRVVIDGKTFAKSGQGYLNPPRFCDAKLTRGGLCGRDGDSAFSGRCWQHQPKPMTAKVREAERARRTGDRRRQKQADEAGRTLYRARTIFEDRCQDLINDLLEAYGADPPMFSSQLTARVDELAQLRIDWQRAQRAFDLVNT